MAPASSNQRSGLEVIRFLHSTNMNPTLHSSVLSIDVGSSGARAALFDKEGNQIEGTLAVRRHSPGEFIKVDPDVLVDEVRRTVDEVRAQPLTAEVEIEATAISTFWHSLVGVDD